MFELTINGQVYQFNFGIGFVREINKKKQAKAENGSIQDVGLNYYIGTLYDENPIALVDILDLANKTEKPRISRKELDAFIDNRDTDLSQVCRDILDFFDESNATKKAAETMKEFVERQMENQNQTSEQ